MREIAASEIAGAVTKLFHKANYRLGADVLAALEKAVREEESPVGKEVLKSILENAAIAAEKNIPLCQDCGIAVVFLEIGQDVHIIGGDLHSAIDEGVRRAYRDGYLRPSMVRHPFSVRRNTGDNTPAVVHTEIVPGEKIKIVAMPKGGGSENMSRLGWLLPGAGWQGVVEFVVGVVGGAGGQPCPPVILGVGIGGTAEKAMLLAKKALLRKVGEPSGDAEVAELEKKILRAVNDLGIGPMGYGGRITALAVNVESFPAHITGLPVAVNLQCHSARIGEAVL